VLRRIVMVFAISLVSVGGLLATPGVGSAAAARHLAPSTAPVLGTWDVSYCWNVAGCGSSTWTISANKTFTDGAGNSGTWSFKAATSEFHIKYTSNTCGTNYISGWTPGSMGDGVNFTNFSSGCLTYGTWSATQTGAQPARARSAARADGVGGATAAPNVSPLLGTWDVSFCWNTGCGSDTWTFNANKSFTDGSGGSGTWSYKSSTTLFKLHYSGGCNSVYIGSYTGNLAGVQYTTFAGGCSQTGTWNAARAAAPAGAANRSHSAVRANRIR
jgi:hypothetical protein